MGMYEHPFVFHFSSYHVSPVFVPHPFDLLKVVCIDPGLDQVLVLGVYWVHRFHFLLSYDSLHRGGTLCRPGDTPALSLADEIPIFAVSNSSPAPSCACPCSPAFPCSAHSLVRFPALRCFPAL